MAAAFQNPKGYGKSKTNMFICNDSAILLPNLRRFSEKPTENHAVVKRVYKIHYIWPITRYVSETKQDRATEPLSCFVSERLQPW